MSDAAVELNPTKIRMGLALVAIAFVASVVLFVVVDDTIGRAIFFAVAVLSLVRAAMLVRWLRRQTASGTSPGDANPDQGVGTTKR